LGSAAKRAGKSASEKPRFGHGTTETACRPSTRAHSRSFSGLSAHLSGGLDHPAFGQRPARRGELTWFDMVQAGLT
jgi:hypothetical protein